VNRVNEFNLEPGAYQHYKGGVYVVTDIITHMDNAKTGAMEPLQDPLVVYRDLTPVVRHVEGRRQMAHQVYARSLSEFTEMIHPSKLAPGAGPKRFNKL
jgi:hypothetical protein